MRWSILTEDRDRPGTYVALVEFGSHPAAMANSAHPATGNWFAELCAISRTSPTFRNHGRHPRPPLLTTPRPDRHRRAR